MIGFQVTGVDHLKSKLRGMRLNALKKGMSAGVTKASRLVNKAAKAKLATAKTKAAVRKKNNLVGSTGLLRESMGFRVRRYRNENVIGVIGPAHGFRKQVGVRVLPGRESKLGDPIFHDPAKIAHLVEFGHAGPHPAPPHPFMRPAMYETQDECMEIIRAALEQTIISEAAS